MKRSSQDKSKTQDASKLRDMQKAYGVLPKDLSKVKGTAAKSVKSTGGVSTSQKSRNSVGGSTSSSKPLESSSSDRKSYPPDTTTKSSSKIIAASKANYVEKYGSTVPKKTTVSGPGSISPRKKPGGITGNNTGNVNSKKLAGNMASGPKQVRSVPKAASVKSSTTSGITSQKPPAFYESETISEPATDDYGEDFEEDYESDFEEMDSSGNESQSPENGNGVADKEDTDEYDNPSSIREFEALEKLVDEDDPFDRSQKPVKLVADVNKNKAPASVEDEGGSGEPVSPLYAHEAAEEDDSGEEDDDEGYPQTLPSPQTQKQNAFPLTTGFSITTSQQAVSPYHQIKRQESARRESGGAHKPESVARTSFKGPGVESGKQEKRRMNRGKIIQDMIKLDSVEVVIFHLAPYQYERFMTIFSGSHRLQASVQTDQDRSEESVQTEPIDQVAKWTQKPPTWSTTSSSVDIRIVRQEALGVGSDDIYEDFPPDQKIQKQFDFLKNWEQLSKFIIRSSRKMLYVLEAEERVKLPASSGNKGSLETIKMSRGLSVLSKLAMHTLSGDGEFVACANGDSEGVQLEPQEKSVNGNKKHTSKNLVTVWSLKEPSMPLFFLRVWGHVSALKLHMIGRLVVSGNKDGSLNVWNLDEPLCYHSRYQEQAIRTPTVNTSCMTPTHETPVVGVEMFADSKNTFSVVSIDKEGTIITWSCLRSQETVSESSISQHGSAWSTVHLSIRHQIPLGSTIRHQLQITCFLAWHTDTTWFITGTFNGFVTKGQLVEQTATAMDRYQERSDSNPKISCMDVSRTLNILVAGCEDGRCRLFEMTRKKLVLSLGGKQEPIRVKWSGRRASVLYVALKDSLLIWDLLSSDMNPWKTIHLKDIQDFVLYTPPHKEYLVVITGKDMIISTPADEVKPLSNRDNTRILSYFSLLS